MPRQNRPADAGSPGDFPKNFIVSANRLRDGRVVYFAARNAWRPTLAAGRRASGRDGGERLLAEAMQAASARQVIDPYLVELDGATEAANRAATGAGTARPKRLRERIRAGGPSVETRVETRAETRFSSGGQADVSL